MTSSPDDDIHYQVSIRASRAPHLRLGERFKPLECAGDRAEKRLVLVHLRSGSLSHAHAARVHVGCIAVEAPYRQMLHDAKSSSARAHERGPGNYSKGVRWPRPKAGDCFRP